MCGRVNIPESAPMSFETLRALLRRHLSQDIIPKSTHTSQRSTEVPTKYTSCKSRMSGTIGADLLVFVSIKLRTQTQTRTIQEHHTQTGTHEHRMQENQHTHTRTHTHETHTHTPHTDAHTHTHARAQTHTHTRAHRTSVRISAFLQLGSY